jgi:hypothetical protein
LLLLKCDWFDPERGVKHDPSLGLVEVNYTSRLRQYEPFVLSYQVDQVYYAPYPSPPRERRDWWVAFKTNPIGCLPLPNVEDEVEDSLPPNSSEYYQDGEPHGTFNVDIADELASANLLHESDIEEPVDPEEMDSLHRSSDHENIDGDVGMDNHCSSDSEEPIESDNDSDNDSDCSG